MIWNPVRLKTTVLTPTDLKPTTRGPNADFPPLLPSFCRNGGFKPAGFPGPALRSRRREREDVCALIGQTCWTRGISHDGQSHPQYQPTDPRRQRGHRGRGPRQKQCHRQLLHMEPRGTAAWLLGSYKLLSLVDSRFCDNEHKLQQLMFMFSTTSHIKSSNRITHQLKNQSAE